MHYVGLDRELAEEVVRRISQQLMESVLPHLKLVQEEEAMNTALISELRPYSNRKAPVLDEMSFIFSLSAPLSHIDFD